ncbi:DUF3093 domain-containing protein [Actinokineospora iranica]|uniref:DUF3093 domain-containing protein n=1 Tax=Actinokineospora iranica TaxID=1271860 RepID=A0A1G6LP03_9PSEU|nr:DUF3093 domain-containing protein [Actinokineospora iranica]SDC45002.1 Protein of unknown function [Actinokineospora iranica]
MTDTSGTGAPTASAPTAKAGPRYAERLRVTWYWWPLPLLAAGLLAAEIHMGYPGVRAWLPYALIMPLTLLLLWQAGRTTVKVEDGELWVADAHLPLEFAGEMTAFTAKDKRHALGAHLDPAAFVQHRGWIGPVVRVRVTDPDDPTPYWVFSVRDPQRLAAAMRAERQSRAQATEQA